MAINHVNISVDYLSGVRRAEFCSCEDIKVAYFLNFFQKKVGESVTLLIFAYSTENVVFRDS